MDQFKKREEVIVSLEAALEASLGRESVLEELQASTHQSLSGMNDQVTTIFSTLAGVELKSKQERLTRDASQRKQEQDSSIGMQLDAMKKLETRVAELCRENELLCQTVKSEHSDKCKALDDLTKEQTRHEQIRVQLNATQADLRFYESTLEDVKHKLLSGQTRESELIREQALTRRILSGNVEHELSVKEHELRIREFLRKQRTNMEILSQEKSHLEQSLDSMRRQNSILYDTLKAVEERERFAEAEKRRAVQEKLDSQASLKRTTERLHKLQSQLAQHESPAGSPAEDPERGRRRPYSTGDHEGLELEGRGSSSEMKRAPPVHRSLHLQSSPLEGLPPKRRDPRIVRDDVEGTPEQQHVGVLGLGWLKGESKVFEDKVLPPSLVLPPFALSFPQPLTPLLLDSCLHR
mmetsp:Transcript_3913/g.14342  ORF Transcript_3913/g.14342 Transcript_3913/m.14342 type:complete len:409 (+) Transcript_3913:1706-2932(+)